MAPTHSEYDFYQTHFDKDLTPRNDFIEFVSRAREKVQRLLTVGEKSPDFFPLHECKITDGFIDRQSPMRIAEDGEGVEIYMNILGSLVEEREDGTYKAVVYCTVNFDRVAEYLGYKPLELAASLKERHVIEHAQFIRFDTASPNVKGEWSEYLDKLVRYHVFDKRRGEDDRETLAIYNFCEENGVVSKDILLLLKFDSTTNPSIQRGLKALHSIQKWYERTKKKCIREG